MTRIAIAAVSLCAMACEPPPPERPGVLTVVQEQQPTWVRNFNPLLASGPRWPTRCGVYEPLFIYNAATATWVPWLATAYEYRDATTLVLTLREGVRWSDGTPFEAHDVVFTFQLLLDNRALDHENLHQFVERVEVDGNQVVFHYTKPYSPGFVDIAHQPIVPEHVVSEVEEPLRWSNPEPVATGPFTEVRVFRPQVFELGANPHYWGGPLGIEALRFPAIGTNDQVALSLIQGEIDWAGAFVPAVDRVYAKRNPEHHHYWFPLHGDTVFLYANTTRAPLGDVRVRKALSMAIDRDKLVEVAMFGYTRPADGTGLSDLFESWRSADVASSADWVTFDVKRANQLLDEAGLARRDDGWRHTPDGARFSVELMVVSGWSDWVRAAQVSSRSLAAIGVEATMRSYDFAAWFEQLGKGEFDLAISWSKSGPSPHGFYQGLMGSESLRPVGEPAGINWHRYASPRMDALLAAFEQTTDPGEQRRIAVTMQEAFATEAPAIPLFTSPSWGEFNTARFTGFPSASNPYARLSPNNPPDPLLVMTRLKRRAP